MTCAGACDDQSKNVTMVTKYNVIKGSMDRSKNYW